MESKPSNPDLDSPIHRPHPILVASKLSIPKGPGHALDNDPRRFLNHLIASIRGESGSFGEALLPSLESIRLPSPGHLSSLVAGEISNLAHPLSVVLDDYHEIQNPHVHECVEELIRFQPRNLHLVILTRVDPPFPLTRYSVEGRMTELRADDLRFNEEDTRQFLELSSGNSIGRSAAAALCEKTEGLPAALQLCALSLRKADSQSVKAFVANFSGQDRYIVDYLLEEVLNRQPAGIIDFLLDTSVLDRFNSDICDWIRGKKDSRQLLNELVQKNMFLIPLDTKECWYRYHSLFSKFLYVRLDRERRQRLHLRAAKWYENNKMPGVAVKHAIESGSAEASARTINQQAEGAFHLGYHTLLGSWLESLSEEFIRTNFELAVYKAWILFLTGKISALRLFLDRIEPDAGRIKDTESYRRYLSLKAWVARSEGDANVVIEMPLLLDSEGRENPTVKLISHLSVARAAYQAGRTDEAVSVLREAYRLERESGNAFAALCALHTLCFYLLDVGQREEIQSLCTEALEIFTDSQGSKLPISGMAYLPLAVSRYEANALDDAKNYSEIGLSLCRNLNLEDILVEDGTRTLARVHLARGRVENAVSLLNDTLKRYETSNLYAPISSLQALRAELAIRRGDIETAMIWAEPRAFDALSPPTGLPGYEHIVFVRLLLARGNLDNASKWLLVMKNGCVQAQRNRMLLTLLLLEVIWCILSEKTADAVRITEQALMIASPQNYRRPFIDELPTIESVVLQCRPIAPDFVESLRVDGTVLSTRSLTAPVSESILDESAAIEPLTRREQEVLKLAAEALANREIADRLFISVGTVKWHMNHILAKLNVPSRSKAVARAKELGLL